LKVSQASRQCVYLKTARPEERTRMVLSKKELEKLENIQSKLLGNSKVLSKEQHPALIINSKSTTSSLLKPISSQSQRILLDLNEKKQISENNIEHHSIENKINKDEDTLEREYFPSLKPEKKKELLFKYNEIFNFLKSIKLSRWY
jgi:hypothetical protein